MRKNRFFLKKTWFLNASSLPWLIQNIVFGQRFRRDDDGKTVELQHKSGNVLRVRSFFFIFYHANFKKRRAIWPLILTTWGENLKTSSGMERIFFGASSELNWTFLAFFVWVQSKKTANLVFAVTTVFFRITWERTGSY